MNSQKDKASVKAELNRRALLAESARESWKDVNVAELRKTRDGVMVTWEGRAMEFKSVRQAFVALGLPDSKHKTFRLGVKANGRGVFEHDGVMYKFFISDPKEGSTAH